MQTIDNIPPGQTEPALCINVTDRFVSWLQESAASSQPANVNVFTWDVQAVLSRTLLKLSPARATNAGFKNKRIYSLKNLSVSSQLLRFVEDETKGYPTRGVDLGFKNAMSKLLSEEGGGLYLDDKRFEDWCTPTPNTRADSLLSDAYKIWRKAELDELFTAGDGEVDFSSHLILYALCRESIAPALKRLLDQSEEGVVLENTRRVDRWEPLDRRNSNRVDIIMKLQHGSRSFNAVFNFRIWVIN